MSLNPSSIQFTHKKGDALPTPFLITHNSGLPWLTHNAPDWITISEKTTTTFKININSGVNILSGGDHNIAIDLVLTDGTDFEYPTLYVDLDLEDTQLLEVSPGSVNFTFIIGGSTPTAKVFNILSEATWNITKNASWLILSTNTGSNNGSFNISVNTSGLSPGVYNDNVTVDDGGTPVVIPVSLTVSDPDTGSDYLNVYPTNLNYGFTSGGVTPPSQDIDINASAAYTAVTGQAWIDLSAASGSSGSSSITVTLQNLGALAVGNHVGYVDLTLGTIVKRITVNLTIYELVTETLDPNTLYFTDDENYIKVSSGRNDTHLLMSIAAAYLGKNYSLPYNIPFFNGIAQKRIGDVAGNIMGDSNIFGMADIAVFSPYLPISLNLSINEIETSSNSILQTSTLNAIKFLKGQKPLTNWLGNLPKTLFLTKNATLLFSVLSDGNPPGNLVFTGDVAQTITPAAQAFEFYTVLIPFSKLTLEVGFEFTVTLLNQSIDVVIIDDNIDHAMLYAEAQWGTFEPFELTGEVKENKNYKDEAFTFRKNHLEEETKVFDRKKRTSYTINTGYIMTEEMVDYLEVLLEAKNYYLQTSSGFRKVRNTTKKMEVKASLRENRQAQLTFEDTIE